MQAAAERPLVSLLLAVRNEAQVLSGCLEALEGQDYPAARMELIVADGQSEDGTRELLEAFARRAPFRVDIVANPGRSAAAGFNACLQVAAGDVVMILGARAIPTPAFVSHGVAALEASGADAVGGVVTAQAEGRPAEAIALALQSHFGAGGARYRSGGAPGDVDTVNYGCYRRAVFTDAGGFDETMDNVEDDEFNYRLRARGKRLFLAPEIRCGYLLRPGLGALARQFARYGYPKVRVLRRHPRQMQARQFAPAALVGVLALGLLGYRFWGGARQLFWLAAGVYASATLLVSLAISRRRGWGYLPFLPPAFAAMHLSYGAASLAGACRFLLWPWLRGEREPSSVPSFQERDACLGLQPDR